MSIDTAQNAARTATLTAVAMIAFAANSLVCRDALGEGAVDAASFAAIRTIAGALTLAVILAARGEITLKFEQRRDPTAASLANPAFAPLRATQSRC